MVGCCNIGPCKKKRSYEFNNASYEPSKKDTETYRRSRLVETEDDETKETVEEEVNGVTEDIENKRDERDGIERRDSKRSTSSRNSKKAAKRNKDKYDEEDHGTGAGDREGDHESETGEKSGETTVTTYTTVVQHQIQDYDADRESGLATANVSSTYNPMEEGHFHSEHQYTVELNPDHSVCATGGPDPDLEKPDDAAERSTIMVNVPSADEDYDNAANTMTENLHDGYNTVTEVHETVIHRDYRYT